MDETMVNPQVTESDIAWLAGFMDGEGTITITIDGHNRLGPQISVANTCFRVMENVERILKGLDVPYYIHTYTPENPKHKASCHIRVMRLNAAKDFINKLLPHLRAKDSQARLVLRFVESRLQHPKYNTKFIPDEHILANSVRNLNRKGTSETIREPFVECEVKI